MDKKKIIATAFATLIGLISLALASGIVPQSAHALTAYAVAALGLVNSLFLPAVLGQSVEPPKVQS